MREVRAGYSPKEKDTRKTRQNHYQICSFHSVGTQSNKSLLRACCMPGTVLGTEKFRDDYNIVLEVVSALLGKLDMSSKVISP